MIPIAQFFQEGKKWDMVKKYYPHALVGAAALSGASGVASKVLDCGVELVVVY